MTPELRSFLQRLLEQSIHSGIQSAFWKMPLIVVLIVVAVLIGIAVHFQLY